MQTPPRLREAVGTPEQLKGAKASLTIGASGTTVIFSLSGWGKQLGKIVAEKPPSGAGGAYVVSFSRVVGGFGPMLYDAAMEWCSEHGGGLTADRESVSAEARRVWDYYLNKRSDVTAHQLDDPDNTLTSTRGDNAGMIAAKSSDPDSFGDESADWQKSSLSKRFTKNPDTLEKLKKMNILKESFTLSLIEALDLPAGSIANSVFCRLHEALQLPNS